MQSPSLPPEIPKSSLAPLWIGIGVVMLMAGLGWGLLSGPSRPEAKPEPTAAVAPESVSKAVFAAPASSAEPPPPPPPAEVPHRPPPAFAIPAEAIAAPGAAGTKAAPAPRDPNCVDPCRGRETPELIAALRSKAGQARSCYERALSNDSMLAGKLEVALRVGASGGACSASIANDTLGDASVKSCALARFLGAKYPKPTGGCVDVSVPMNFKPGGSR